MADVNTLYGDGAPAADLTSDDQGGNDPGNMGSTKSGASVLYPNLPSTQEWASGEPENSGEAKPPKDTTLATMQNAQDQPQQAVQEYSDKSPTNGTGGGNTAANSSSTGTNSNSAAAPTQQIIKPWNEFDADVANEKYYSFKQEGKFYAKTGDTLYEGTDGSNGDVVLTPVPEDKAKDVMWDYVTQHGFNFTQDGQQYAYCGGKVYQLMHDDQSGLFHYSELPKEETKRYDIYISQHPEMWPEDKPLETPLIDPIDVVGAGMAKAGLVAARTTGSVLRRAGAAAIAGGKEMAEDVVKQAVTEPIFKEIKAQTIYKH